MLFDGPVTPPSDPSQLLTVQSGAGLRASGKVTLAYLFAIDPGCEKPRLALNELVSWRAGDGA